jgi:hypothetical protein
MPALSFTDADLKANREGRLMDAQLQQLEKRLAEKRRSNRIVLPIAGLGFGAILLLGLLLVANDSLSQTRPQDALALAFGMIVVCSLLYAVVAAAAWWPIRAASRGDIHQATAVCEMFYRPYGKDEEKATYVLKIRKRWIGTQTIYVQDVDSLRHGQRYRVYYLEDNPLMILSWEETSES